MTRAAKSKHVNTTQTLRRKLVSANSTFGGIAVSGLVVPCLYHPCMRISITCIDGLIRFNLWECSNKIFLFCHWVLTFYTHCNQVKFLLGSTKETCMFAIVKHNRLRRSKTLNWSLPDKESSLSAMHFWSCSVTIMQEWEVKHNSPVSITFLWQDVTLTRSFNVWIFFLPRAGPW